MGEIGEHCRRTKIFSSGSHLRMENHFCQKQEYLHFRHLAPPLVNTRNYIQKSSNLNNPAKSRHNFSDYIILDLQCQLDYVHFLIQFNLLLKLSPSSSISRTELALLSLFSSKWTTPDPKKYQSWLELVWLGLVWYYMVKMKTISIFL